MPAAAFPAAVRLGCLRGGVTCRADFRRGLPPPLAAGALEPDADADADADASSWLGGGARGEMCNSTHRRVWGVHAPSHCHPLRAWSAPTHEWSAEDVAVVPPPLPHQVALRRCLSHRPHYQSHHHWSMAQLVHQNRHQAPHQLQLQLHYLHPHLPRHRCLPCVWVVAATPAWVAAAA